MTDRRKQSAAEAEAETDQLPETSRSRLLGNLQTFMDLSNDTLTRIAGEIRDQVPQYEREQLIVRLVLLANQLR